MVEDLVTVDEYDCYKSKLPWLLRYPGSHRPKQGRSPLNNLTIEPSLLQPKIGNFNISRVICNVLGFEGRIPLHFSQSCLS